MVRLIYKGCPTSNDMFSFYCLFFLSVAITLSATTCGYKDGDPQEPRTVDPGWACRVDTELGLWGFCPETVISARDCGLAGVCVDSHSCTAGCGRLTDRMDITTFSCEKPQFCSTALSINGPDQSYEYIACGATAKTDTLFPVPTVAETTTIPSSSTSATSGSVNSPALRSTAAAAETSSPPALSSSSVMHSLITSPPSGPTTSASFSSPSSPSSSSSLNLGAVVGGAIGGLIVICLTILGIVLIRRKHGAMAQAMSPTHFDNYGRKTIANDTPLRVHELGDLKKHNHWDSSHSIVELYSEPRVNMEPTELPGHMATPKGIR